MAEILAKLCLGSKQYFENPRRYPCAMDDIREILARNLAKLMAMSADCRTQNALAKRSKVAQTTIGNYLNKTYVGYPNLAKIEQLAQSFGLEAWNLLHPNLGEREISEKEILMYRRWKEDIKQLHEQ